MCDAKHQGVDCALPLLPPPPTRLRPSTEPTGTDVGDALQASSADTMELRSAQIVGRWAAAIFAIALLVLIVVVCVVSRGDDTNASVVFSVVVDFLSAAYEGRANARPQFVAEYSKDVNN